MRDDHFLLHFSTAHLKSYHKYKQIIVVTWQYLDAAVNLIINIIHNLPSVGS